MSDENQYPSFAEQSANLTNTAFSLLKAMINGEAIMASSKVQEERMDICKVCDKNDGNGKCMACGCILEWKVPFAMNNCPEGKWDFDEDSFKETFQERLDNNSESD